MNHVSNFNRCSAVHLPQDRKSVDVSDEYKGNGKYEPLKEQQTDADIPDHQNINTEKPASPGMAKDHLKGFTKGKIKICHVSLSIVDLPKIFVKMYLF